MTLFDAERLFQNSLGNEFEKTNLLRLLINLCNFSLELEQKNKENKYDQILVNNADRCQFGNDLNYSQSSFSLEQRDDFDQTKSESHQNSNFNINNHENKDLRDAQNLEDSYVHNPDVMVKEKTPDRDINIHEKLEEG